MVGSFLLAISLSGCASAAAGEVIDTPVVMSEPDATTEPTAPSDGESAAAREQAQAWLNAVALPTGAVRSGASVSSFNSYTGWPCGPIEELEAFWMIADANVRDTANWLMEHPTADLIATTVSPVSDDPAIDSATVGYIPEPGSQEGIVYTIAKTNDGVAVRAEIAALTESAVCPTPPGGGVWGPPGQG